jgi:hypothetical protein
MAKISTRKPAAAVHLADRRAVTAPVAARGIKAKPGRSNPRAAAPSKKKVAQPQPSQSAGKPIPANKRGSKLDTVVQLMQSKGGASIDRLVKATGWQPHSVRGAISGAIKKKLGHNVVSARVDGVRVYRIVK